jgi:hypothetical protein
MSFSKQEREKIKSVLREAYQEKENLEIGELREYDLMHGIWDFVTMPSTPRFLTVFEQFVWQLVPLTSLLILILTGLLLLLDWASGYDVFQLLTNGKEEFSLSQMLGV